MANSNGLNEQFEAFTRTGYTIRSPAMNDESAAWFGVAEQEESWRKGVLYNWKLEEGEEESEPSTK